jgi:hypothetical protein
MLDWECFEKGELVVEAALDQGLAEPCPIRHQMVE